MKKCCTCLIEKETSNFHRCKSLSDGLYKVCKQCRKTTSKEYRERHGDKIRDNWRKTYAKDPTKHRANSLRCAKANPQRCRDAGKRWSKNNRLKANEYTAKRYAAFKQATPSWLNKKQRAEIKWFYDTARDLQWLSNEKLCVDHIEPLRGVISSGLHVPWNLQIISLSGNSRKGNKLGDTRG